MYNITLSCVGLDSNQRCAWPWATLDGKVISERYKLRLVRRYWEGWNEA